MELNNSPLLAEAFNDLPVKTVNGTTIYLRDVAQVRDGAAVQTNIVRHDGRRGALLTVLKNGNVSTIDIVQQDQSRAAAHSRFPAPGVASHARCSINRFSLRAAISTAWSKKPWSRPLLTGLMILLFLGSWRSTLIVCISIPLSILTSLAILYALGETINIMTLGGMALAVGILVDDATVEIENIHRNLGMGKGVMPAILDGARQIAVPAFVSTLCICIVFVPVVFLTGAAQVSVHAAGAGGGAGDGGVLPAFANAGADHDPLPDSRRTASLSQGRKTKRKCVTRGIIWDGPSRVSTSGFEKMRDGYSGMLAFDAGIIASWWWCCFVLVVGRLRAALYPFIGTDFFPQVDAGQIRLHVRCPGGTRIEETERSFVAGGGFHPQNYSARMRSPDILDNIGLPYSGFNLAFTDSVTLGPVRWRNSGFAEAGRASVHLGLCARDAAQAGSRVSGSDVFLSARRHCRTDSELRIARAD